MKLRPKILLVIGAALALSTAAAVTYLQLRFSGQLRLELEKRGVSIARNLAHHSTAAALARDRLALKMIAVAQEKSESDIAYIFFLGPGGRTVLAHTFGDSFPSALLEVNPLPAGKEYGVRYLATGEGEVYDVAMQIGGGGLGTVRVGLSAGPVTTAVNELTGEVLLVLVLLGGGAMLLSFPLSAGITRPVKELIAASEALAAGNYDRHVPAKRKDEIGQLATSFNRMAQQLEEARRDLVARNTELAAEVERRSEAETRLEAQLNLISILMDEIPAPVYFKDAKGVYLGCNRAFEAFTGINRGELCGSTIDTIFSPEEARVHMEAESRLLSSTGTCRYEHPFTTGSGERRDVIFQKATYNNSAGELAGMVGILVDVTSDREVDRLRNDFVSTAAHEFHTPLTAVLGFCDLLLDDESLPPETVRRYLRIIHEHAGYLARLVERLLDVSRIESGRPVPLDLRPCRAGELLQGILQKYLATESRHRFELRLPPKAPIILVDELRFSEVIENLLGNAVKYSPEGSAVIVEGALLDVNTFMITVTDQGPGLTSEQRARIFEKFYRVDSSHSAPDGTGLGLYISRAIMTAHEGSLEAVPAPGGGSRFVVTVPVIPGC